eukprot:CAMPEP_0201927842 /NCGR_PEP_ID=MMETSP0903-20130614/19609_1 /ASSEMBLY_ACC=CAM_ASM_000552 /TAXON_ID=420261 /ORGANISM="Thalassiosira antarctica, Strain CCMP982" /LENGTH=633 /DNA_ID=CAMNT_0048466135 /DNA_START=34 /DNA_END=1932 /DNA_ORIENTATION=+
MNGHSRITTLFATAFCLSCAATTTASITGQQFPEDESVSITRGTVDSSSRLQRRMKKHKSVSNERERSNKKEKSVANETERWKKPSGHEKRMVYCGTPNKCNSLGGNAVVADMNDRHAVRCCSEDANLDWRLRCNRDPTVYGESNIGGTCHGEATFKGAMDICTSAGGRLCTSEEMMDSCTHGTGCGFNRKLTWGCTADQDACTNAAECCGGYCNVRNGASEGVCSDESAPTWKASPNTLSKQIICGYQGWFSFPGDGAPTNRWKHWFKNPGDPDAPKIEELSIDSFPTTDEYDDEDLIETGIPMKDGSYAKFYSSVKPRVVMKHFEWMATYGITGVFHMRFMESLHLPNNREWKTMVLRNVRSAAQATGRAFAVSYNIAGQTLDNDVLDDLKADWIRLVDEEQITQSGRYIRQDGKPVLRIFGIGFESVKVTDTNRLADLIDWFQNRAEPKYRVFLIGGVPSAWRDLDNDSREEPEWKGIYDSLDGIHPWHVGRWQDIKGFDNYYNSKISLDADYCNGKRILYMPTMWPGFSWHNLKDNSPVNQIPRLGGNFMWRQAYKYVADSNIKTIWMAQFDEVDEGTAIMKVAATEDDLPTEGNWLTHDVGGHSLPSDWYLRLCGEAQKMLDGETRLR